MQAQVSSLHCWWGPQEMSAWLCVVLVLWHLTQGQRVRMIKERKQGRVGEREDTESPFPPLSCPGDAVKLRTPAPAAVSQGGVSDCHCLPRPRDLRIWIPPVTSSVATTHHAGKSSLVMKAAPKCLPGVCPQCVVQTLAGSDDFILHRQNKARGPCCPHLYPSWIRDPCFLPGPRL